MHSRVKVGLQLLYITCFLLTWLTRPLSRATLCAASRAMALATVSGMSVPLGWGRILWGDGERWFWQAGASRVCPCGRPVGMPNGEQPGSHGWGGPPPRWSIPGPGSLVSSSLALSGLCDWGRDSWGMWGWGIGIAGWGWSMGMASWGWGMAMGCWSCGIGMGGWGICMDIWSWGIGIVGWGWGMGCCGKGWRWGGEGCVGWGIRWGWRWDGGWLGWMGRGWRWVGGCGPGWGGRARIWGWGGIGWDCWGGRGDCMWWEGGRVLGRGTSRWFGMSAAWESWDSPCADKVLTITSRASKHWRRFSSTAA